MRCIYCDEDKPHGQFSLEHIFPSSIGGKLCDGFFKTRRVCADCNSKAGNSVDGPFLKGALLKNSDARAQLDFVDPGLDNSWSPFFYKGRVLNFETIPGEVCEMWEGAHGEHVYHLHDADAPAFDAYVGGNPTRRRREPGRAYLFLTDSRSGRMAFTLRSFKRQFKSAQRHAGNFSFEDDGGGIVMELPAERNREFERLTAFARSREPKKLRVHLDLGAMELFLAKLGRALGHNLFGEACLDTAVGAGLRKAMWERDAVKRRALATYLTGAPGMREVGALARYPGAYTIHLAANDLGFVLGLTTPGGDSGYVTIADQPSLWEGPNFEAYRDGEIYVVAPGAGMFVGPLDFPTLHAHRTGVARRDELQALDARRRCAIEPVSFQFGSLPIGGGR